MRRETIDERIAVYRDGLLNDVLPFWIRHGADREHGGIMTCLDRDGTVLDTDKGVWQQGRFAWMLGHLYNHLDPRPEWLDLARRTVQFLLKHGPSPTGQLYFHVTRDGRPIRRRRYAYSESFAAIALAEYAKATGSDEAAAKAREFFDTFVRFHTEPGLSPPKFEPTRPMKSIGFPMITIVTAQVLRDALGDDGDTRRIDEAVAAIRRDFLKPDIGCVMETVGPKGEILDHFDGRILNPGHAIEAAWFILREAQHRGGDRRLLRTGTDMLDWMWGRGWDEEHGGLFYFRDVRGLPVSEYWHDMKFWWPHNEAIIATLLAYRLTGDAKYAEWHRAVHDWAYRHFPDPEHGEWYGYLHRDGTVSSRLKGNLWKGCFHLPRMQWTCWQILEEMKRELPPSAGAGG